MLPHKSLLIIMIISTVNGLDFIVTDPVELVFMANTTFSGNTLCATISIINDAALEGLHSFNVSIMGSDPPLMINESQASVNIIDDEGMTDHEQIFCFYSMNHSAL